MRVNMPDKNPDLWAILLSWLAQNYHTLASGAMSFLVAMVRIFYSGKRGKRQLLEAVLCGLIAVAVASALKPAGVDPEYSTFIATMIGFYGVETIRSLGLTIIEKKTGAAK